MSRSRLTTKYLDAKAGATYKTRLRVNYGELQAAWTKFLGGIPWAVFAGLTFDPKRVFPVGEARARREAWDWCVLLGRIVRRPVAWLFVTERGRSGLWHSHAVVTDMTVTEVETAADIWRRRNGFVDVRDVWAAEGLTLYLSKEIPRGAEFVFSDTVERYRDRLCNDRRVQLVVQEELSLPSDAGCGEYDYWTPFKFDLGAAIDTFLNRRG